MQLYANEVGRNAVGIYCQRRTYYVRCARGEHTQKYVTSNRKFAREEEEENSLIEKNLFNFLFELTKKMKMYTIISTWIQQYRQCEWSKSFSLLRCPN